MLPSVGSELDFEEALGTLCGYGFLESIDEQETFHMHSLVHFMTQVWVKDKKADLAAKKDALSHMEEVFPHDAEWEQRHQWQQYMPHALKLFHQLKGVNAQSATCLARAIGICHLWDGQMQDSIGILKEAVAIADVFAYDDSNRLHAQYELGSAYLKNSQASESLSLLQSVVEIRQRALPDDHAECLRSQNRLAAAYLESRQVSDAVELFQYVLEKRKGLAEDHPLRLASQHELARAYLKNGQISDAIKLLEHVVEIEQALTEDHPSRLVSQHALATAYLEMGQMFDGIKLLEHVVKIEQMLAQDHPSRLISQQELAGAYLKNGQTSDAIKLQKHVVEGRKSLGKYHSLYLQAEYNLARAYLSDGQLPTGINLLQHVMAKEESLAEDDRERLMTQIALGEAYTRSHNPQLAQPLLKKVVKIAKRIWPEDNADRGWAEKCLQECQDANSAE